MNVQVKQRVVGAIVLVSLAVIFIPMLLPGKGSISTSIHGSNVPPAPDYRFPPPKEAPPAPQLEEAPPVPVNGDTATSAAQKSGDAKPVEQKPAPAKIIAKTEPKAEPKTHIAPKAEADPVKTPPSGEVTAWIVQVGSFSDNDNAQALRDKLRKMGYASFVEAVKGEQGMVYRVRVGPELTRKSAEKLSVRLKKDANLTGLVQSYP